MLNLQDSHLLDKECFDSIESNPNTVIPWFIMYMCAREKYSDELLSPSLRINISRRIKTSWDELDHQMKDCLKFDRLENTLEVVRPPDKFDLIYSTLKKIQSNLTFCEIGGLQTT
jgi:hypothetical protein